MSLLRRAYPAVSYLKYWLHAVDEHSLHSPFLFQFYSQVIKSQAGPTAADQIEHRRIELLSDNSIIHLQDPGAGSLVDSSQQRQVRSIARHSLSSPAFCKLLYRLAHHNGSKNILEIGTSLGISASYLALASQNTSVVTLEGSPAISAIAKATFEGLGLTNIRLMEGNAASLLRDLQATQRTWDLVYIDAHHTEEATINFFHQLLPCLHAKSIVVIGDIYWSAGMTTAWTSLCAHPSVTLAADLFYAGLLFFNADLRKETEVLWW